MCAGRIFRPGQGNNTYIFPGLGLGVLASGATTITSDMLRVAARRLSQMVSDADLDVGCLFPPIDDIRAVSLWVATAVAEYAWSQTLTKRPRPGDVEAHVADMMYHPAHDVLQNPQC
jgi:malate dehydrogenase (oxaloacetate-decarboxylating)(NADP+)